MHTMIDHHKRKPCINQYHSISIIPVSQKERTGEGEIFNVDCQLGRMSSEPETNGSSPPTLPYQQGEK